MSELLFSVGFDEMSQDFDVSLSDTSQDMELDLGEVQLVRVTELDHSNLENRDLADQHPMSAITGLETTLSSIQQDKHFVYNQNTASSAWVVTHTLNKMPAVSVVDSGGSIVVGEVQYISSNKIVITFAGAFSGKAYLN